MPRFSLWSMIFCDDEIFCKRSMPPKKTSGALSAAVIDKMGKGELVTLCEDEGIDGGKTIAQMRLQLKKHFEAHTSRDDDDDDALPPAKKVKATAGSSSGSKACPDGAECEDLHLLSHRLEMSHLGFRDNPIKCREGLGCSQLRDKSHLQKYAHDDSNVCKQGSNCPKLHLIGHRTEMEHPGFRINPYTCRYGMKCEQMFDKLHLQKYAHSEDTTPAEPNKKLGGPTPPAPETASPLPPSSPPAPPSVVPAPTPVPPVSAESSNAAVPGGRDRDIQEMVKGKTWDDFKLEDSTGATLVALDKDTEEFWDVEEKFLANMQGRNEDYVAKRIKAGKKPLKFILVGVERVVHPILECRYELMRQQLLSTREAKECRERVSFHGTHPKNISSILKTGLLRFKHPLNPCKQQVDDGYFGTNRKGIYVSRYADYTLKYSNRVAALDPGDEVKTIMFKTLPGKSKHIATLVGGIDPTDGFDSHSSPTFLEWYLFNEAQCCPQYVLKVRAVEDTRTAADDE